MEAEASRSEFGHKDQHIFRGADHHRDYDNSKRDRPSPAREMPHGGDHDFIDEKADDNRGRAQKNIVYKSYNDGEAGMAAVFSRCRSRPTYRAGRRSRLRALL